MYFVVAVLVAGLGAAGYLAFRLRRTTETDHVSPSVLDRIRTEYR
jgi:hypothetical protein